MSKRIKILVSTLVVVLLLTVGTAAAVMAQEEPTPTSEAGKRGCLARVAEILGIPQEDLVSAFKQAQLEIREQARIRALDRAVEKGRINEGEADEIEEWYEQRPEVLDSGVFRHSFGSPAFHGGHTWGGHRGGCWTRLPELGD